MSSKIQKSSHYDGRKNEVRGSFSSKNLFSTYFLPKTPKKHHKNLVKPHHGFQKHKKKKYIPKLEINPKPKIFPSSDLFF
jgi:hypothetical protein